MMAASVDWGLLRAAPQGMAGALHAEWTKLRTAPGTIWLLAASAVLTAVVSTAAVASTRCPSGAVCQVDAVKISLTGVDLGQAVVAILAVLAVAGEYSTGMIRSPWPRCHGGPWCWRPRPS